MFLIYAYIAKYKNYVNQEVLFDPAYTVTFRDGSLSFTYRGHSAPSRVLRAGKKPDRLHLVVGKTGSGKTNLLQLIGMKHDLRQQRKWDGEEDAYFFLYSINKREYFLEICDLEFKQFPVERLPEDLSMPEWIRPAAARMDTVRTVRFSIPEDLTVGKTYQVFEQTKVDRGGKGSGQKAASARCEIVNCYDKNAFLTPPYPDDKEDYRDFGNDWVGRIAAPYHRTSLWHVCDYIWDYMERIESGKVKRQVSFVLSTHNFAESYPIKLPEALEEGEYWTFYQIKQDEQRAEFDEDAKRRMSRRRKRDNLSNKQMFLHDLWADYAHYLRKWVEKILSYRAEEKPPEEHMDDSGLSDDYQEFIDYYTSKEYQDRCEPSELPDGRSMAIVKRCVWLAEYIDRVDNGDPHGVLWQITDDIKDIVELLSQLDDRYFTIDTCTVPVADMALLEHQKLFEELFERMEGYIPDNAGIFTSQLLPYQFTHMSTGEYQYAKILGGLEDCLRRSRISQDGTRTKGDKIILLDEPEAYMHPELARNFFSELCHIASKYTDCASQVIIGTHSPFLLSDVLPEEVTRLDIDGRTGNAAVMTGSDKAYFGANIHTILADSFFLDYTIGESARAFLQTSFDRLQKDMERIDALPDTEKRFIATMREFVPHIGDDLIRRAFEITLQRFPEREEPGL
ncbi:AAA family ATPase [Intestinimonas sp. HCP28S3_D6]|uniref:AAA family ATPase n=1 Tax=Intestinimonas sp. HCP28S3_D6 TaxID=3438942 RepID=UPI003F8B98B4